MRMKAVLLMVLLVLASCSANKSSATKSSATTSTTAPASTTAPPSTGAPASTTAPGSTRAPSSTTAPASTTASGATATSAAPPPTPVTTPAGPCAGTAPPPTWDHVVLIVMENHGLDQIVGSPQAPYLNHLGAQCGLAVNYSGITHPSLPNYIALTSGSTDGISDDNPPSAHPISGPSIFGLLGSGWRSLEESMPSDCDQVSSGEYAVKHNPAAYYTAIAAACHAQDVPLVNPPDLSARFTFITPNLCDDMHDCPTSSGDTWLSHEVPMILNSSEYRAGRTVLFITWDENDSGGTLVPLFVVAPSVKPATRAGQAFNHYSLLRSTEEMLGLTPLLGAAASAASLRGAFHL